jgi:hypothetical protein
MQDNTLCSSKSPQNVRIYHKWSNPPPIPVIPPLSPRLPQYTPTLRSPLSLNPSYSTSAPPLLDCSPAPSHSPEPLQSTPSTGLALLTEIIHPLQTRLRAPKRSHEQKMMDLVQAVDKVLDCVHEQGFTSIPHFLDIFFLIPPQGVEHDDPRSPRHIHSVSSFLTGNDTFKASHLIERLYRHPSGYPRYSSARREETELAFTPSTSRIHYARPALASWALDIVGEKVYREVGQLTKVKKNEGESPIHLRVGTNGRGQKTRIVTWDDIKGLDFKMLDTCFKKEAPVAMHLLECMAAPRKGGKVVVRKRRPFYLVS